VKRCIHCGRTVWESLDCIPGQRPKGSGVYYHHHNGDRLCFPNQNAEVDKGNPGQEYPVEPEGVEVVKQCES